MAGSSEDSISADSSSNGNKSLSGDLAMKNAAFEGVATKSNHNDTATSKGSYAVDDSSERNSIDESEDQSEGGDRDDSNANFIGVDTGTSTYSSSTKPEKDEENDKKRMKTRSRNSSDTATISKDAMDTDDVEAKLPINGADKSGTKKRSSDEARIMPRRTSKRQRASSINNEIEVLPKKRKPTNLEKMEENVAREDTKPKYRWIDDGVKGVHQGLEIDFGAQDHCHANNTYTNPHDRTHPSTLIVRPGDIILISSSEVPWDDKTKDDNVEGVSSRQTGDGEATTLYNDPASREPGIGALDPFIGYVESMYEENPVHTAAGLKKNNSKSSDASLSQMKVRTRWFFKKEEVKGLRGRLTMNGQEKGGDSTDQFFDAMTSKDLILTDQFDDNNVSSILSKATVVRRKSFGLSNEGEMPVPDGAFVCRYQLRFCTALSDGGEGTVEVYPFVDEADNFQIDELNKISSQSSASSTDDGNSSAKEETEASGNYSQVGYPLSPRRLITEGSTVGKIHVGPNHQAVVPEQIDLERKISRRGMTNPPSSRMPTLVWDPKSNDDDLVNKFLDEACELLVEKCITKSGMKPFHDTNCVESPNLKSEAKRPRECRIDVLLIELHNCKYDAKKALKRVLEKPEKFLTIWTRNEKVQFDASYRVYRESLRAISQSIGGERSTNDVIDYLYRFKLVENFRRFSAKKREKAREMMQTVENRMLNEKAKEHAKNEYDGVSDDSSSGDENGNDDAKNDGGVLSRVSTAGPVNNRIRTWFRTGGGNEDAVGAAQLRRNEAANLLTMIKDQVGEDAYTVLAKSLKAYYARSGASLEGVKNAAADIMKAHPELLNSFEAFLPKEIRSS